MWEATLENLTIPCATFVAVQEKHRRFLTRKIRLATEIWLKPTLGQADTLRQSLKFLEALRRESDDELLVVNCDLGFAPGLLDRVVLAGQAYDRPSALTFPATAAEQSRWSYVDGHPWFQEAEEKRAVGTHALAGAYYFPSRTFLAEAVDEAVDWNLGTGHEPYISHVYQFLLTNKISVECRREDLYDWGTPEALGDWQEKNK